MPKRKTIELPNGSFYEAERYIDEPEHITITDKFFDSWMSEMRQKWVKQDYGLRWFFNRVFWISKRRLNKLHSFQTRWKQIKEKLSAPIKFLNKMRLFEEFDIDQLRKSYGSYIQDLNFDLIDLIMDMEDFQTNI